MRLVGQTIAFCGLPSRRHKPNVPARRHKPIVCPTLLSLSVMPTLRPGLGTLVLLALAGAISLPFLAGGSASPIRFELKPIPFRLEHGEVTARHVPATMAGGVAGFDYNKDRRPDMVFT